jgi:hypothetical protein
MYFADGTIYSYGDHFPMARHDLRNSAVLFTTDSYSQTTAQHLSLTRQAIPRYKTVFYVTNVKADDKKAHGANFKDYKARINELLKKAVKARTQRGYYLGEAEQLANEANLYADTYKLRLKRVDLSDLDLDKFKEDIEKARKRELAKKKREEKAKLKANAARIQKWKEGAAIRLGYDIKKTFIRLTDDRQQIQTSKGSFVPVDVARPLWDLVTCCRNYKKEFTGSFKVGRFTFQRATAKGDIYIDCHHIEYDELLDMAGQLGFVS